MTGTWDDEKVAHLVDRKGLAGYGVWCRVLDIVAAAMEPGSVKCSVRYPVTTWSHLLSLRGSHVRHCLEELAVTT